MSQNFGEWLGESFGNGGWISDGISEGGKFAAGVFGGDATSARDERIRMAEIEAEKAQAQAAAEIEKARLDALNKAYGSGTRRSGNMGPAGFRRQPWKEIPTLSKARQVNQRGGNSSGGAALGLGLLGGGLLLLRAMGGKKNA